MLLFAINLIPLPAVESTGAESVEFVFRSRLFRCRWRTAFRRRAGVVVTLRFWSSGDGGGADTGVR